MSIVRDTVERERKATRDTLVASLRANVNISGGGVISWDSNGYFNSTNRFIVFANGRGTFFSTSGSFNIVIPKSGTIQGVGGAPSVTATSAGIPIFAWRALYYILPIGGDKSSIASNFRLVLSNNNIVIPDNWILIASKNGDTSSLTVAGGKYTLHYGESINTAKYSSAFVPNADLVRGLPADFTSSKATNGYQKLPSGLIIQWGQVSVSVSANTSTSYSFTFPTAFPTACIEAYSTQGNYINSTSTIEKLQASSVTGYCFFSSAQTLIIRIYAIGY